MSQAALKKYHFARLLLILLHTRLLLSRWLKDARFNLFIFSFEVRVFKLKILSQIAYIHSFIFMHFFVTVTIFVRTVGFVQNNSKKKKGRIMFSNSLHCLLINLCQYNSPVKHLAIIGITDDPGGVLPYENDGVARRKFSKTPLKGTRISRCEGGFEFISTPMRYQF